MRHNAHTHHLTPTTHHHRQEAAVQGQLTLPTFRRLNVAVMLQSALGLTVLAQGVSVCTPQLAGEEVGSMGGPEERGVG